MSNLPQTREEKIELLKELQAGKISLSELHSSGPWILDWDCPGGTGALNTSSRQVISREQFEKRETAGAVGGIVIDWGVEPVEILIHE